MSLYISAEPDRAQPFESFDSDVPKFEVVTIVHGLRMAYVQRVELYYSALRTALGASTDTAVRASAFERVSLAGDEPDVVVIDGDLLATLIELYVLEGWSPIANIESVLEARARPQNAPGEVSAGVPALPVLVAYDFFIFCRNVLALFIREALVDLEHRAAKRIVAHLVATETKIAAARDSDFSVDEVVGNVSPDGVGPDRVKVFKLRDREMAKALMTAITDAVAQRVAFEQLLKQIANVRARLERIDNAIGAARVRGFAPAHADVDERTWLAEFEKKQSDLASAISGYYAAMKATIGANYPLALLVVDALKPGFTEQELEQRLGEALWTLADKLIDLRRDIDPGTSLVERHLPTVSGSFSGRIDLADVQKLRIGREGPENAIVTAAIQGLRRSRAWFPMLHETTWRLLVHQGEIGKDSLGYVVMHHYLERCGDALAAEAGSDAAATGFWQNFGKVSSALAIALILTPLAEFAPALVGVSDAANMMLIAWQISSVSGQLTQLDRALASVLLEPDAYAMPSLGRIGELMIVRGEFMDQISTQLLVELVGIMAAGRWTTVRRLIVTRGFLMDVETILGFGDAEG